MWLGNSLHISLAPRGLYEEYGYHILSSLPPFTTGELPFGKPNIALENRHSKTGIDFHYISFIKVIQPQTSWAPFSIATSLQGTPRYFIPNLLEGHPRPLSNVQSLLELSLVAVGTQ